MGRMERFNSLVGVFSRGRRSRSPLVFSRLVSESGKSNDFLRPGYGSVRSLESIRAVGLAAGRLMREAGLFSGKPEAVVAYLYGGEEPEVEDAIARGLALLLCQDCGGFFEADKYLKPFSRCVSCYRDHSASPTTKAWLKSIDRLISKAPEELQVAWKTARAEPRSVSYKRLAELTKQPEAELRAAWEAAGLPLRPAGRPRKDTRDNDSRKITFWGNVGAAPLAPRQRKPVWLRAGRSSSRRTARAGVGQTSFPFAPAAPPPGSAEAA